MTRPILRVLLIVGCLGCTKPVPMPAPKTPAGSVPVPTGPTAAPTTPTIALPTDADGFVRKALAEAIAGRLTPEQLAPEFKQIVAEPVGGEDQQKGYSDDRAQRWLEKFRGLPEATSVTSAQSGDNIFCVGRGGDQSYRIRAILKDGRYSVAWLSTHKLPAGTPLSQGINADLGGFIMPAFIEALLAKDDRLAEGLLSQALKAKLAPPFSSDKRGYNRGTLESKLSTFRGFSHYSTTSISAKDGTFLLHNGNSTRTLRLTCSTLVESIEFP
ncbi:MAG: hypothetical protein ACRCZF_28390 [Gemmataceae bacterium]